jgi:magnesium chelatase family protein
MIGPPGSGKSMMAARLPTILPPLEQSDRVESAMIHSVAGLPYETILQGYQPFRAPHHSATRAGLLGGGSPPAPGEVSLAHNGVLFLDEMPEFGTAVLQLLRQPIETGEVSLARAKGTTIFPAKFMLIGASNPCPCGYYGDPEQHCKCGDTEITRYQSKIGGPLLDRFDMVVDVWRSKPNQVLATGTGLSSTKMLEGVLKAIEFRALREQQKIKVDSQNSKMDIAKAILNEADPGKGARLLESCQLGKKELNNLEQAAKHFCLSGRGIMRAVGVARTIADIEQCQRVTSDHLMEAVAFRAEGRAGNE